MDETELAVRLLREVLNRLRAPGVRGGSGAALSALQWACIDSGRWDEALAAASKMETVASSADLATATVLAMRGDHEQVRPLLASAAGSCQVIVFASWTPLRRGSGACQPTFSPVPVPARARRTGARRLPSARTPRSSVCEAGCACDDLGVVSRMVVVEAGPWPEGPG